MNYREMKDGSRTSVLGFGTMRLPIVGGKESQVDYDETTRMIRHAIDSGINYVDTAYIYHGGNSEVAVGKALEGGYREKVRLVTKLPPWALKTEADMERILNEQLSRLKTDHLDLYLLHALDSKYWQHLKSLNVFDFIERIKSDGRVKQIGFSFHGDAALFVEILETYPWDACMIQMNYIDQDTQATLAGLKKAESMGIPVIIMEPLKGGQLARLPEEIQSVFDGVEPGVSGVEWSLRWLADQSGVRTILSGMSNMEQLEDNLRIADRLQVASLPESARQCYESARKMFDDRVKVPCTQCGYCMPCPVGVQIPKNFKLYNEAHIYNDHKNSAYSYHKMMKEGDRASACIACHACEPKCPQGIAISDAMKEVSECFGDAFRGETYHWSF